ncbi:unnamed protein product [Closterium sp. NIES-54]
MPVCLRVTSEAPFVPSFISSYRLSLGALAALPLLWPLPRCPLLATSPRNLDAPHIILTRSFCPSILPCSSPCPPPPPLTSPRRADLASLLPATGAVLHLEAAAVLLAKVRFVTVGIVMVTGPGRAGSAVLCCAVLCCAVLCCAVLCCAVLCCAVLCCAVLCCAVLCCAVLCGVVLCCAMQCRVVRFSAVLWSAGWCRSVLCCDVPCCAVLVPFMAIPFQMGELPVVVSPPNCHTFCLIWSPTPLRPPLLSTAPPFFPVLVPPPSPAPAPSPSHCVSATAPPPTPHHDSAAAPPPVPSDPEACEGGMRAPAGSLPACIVQVEQHSHFHFSCCFFIMVKARFDNAGNLVVKII